MATPDGIEAEDWGQLKEIAIAVLDSLSDPAADRKIRREVLAYLDQLESKYGARPSILATRADFTEDDDSLKERLLHEAYDLATAAHDMLNCMLVAHSLAELYIEELLDVAQGERWLHRLDDHLLQAPDSYYSNDAKTLRGKLEELIPDP